MRADLSPIEFLNIVADSWRESGEWPLIARLKVQLDLREDDVLRLLEQLSIFDCRLVSRAGQRDSRRLVLSPSGLERTEGGLDEVRPLLALIRLAARRRIAAPCEGVAISYGEAVEAIPPPLREHSARLLTYCEEFWAGGQAKTADSTGLLQLGGDLHVVRFETVSSGAEYMALLTPAVRHLYWDEIRGAPLEILKAIYLHWRDSGEWPRLADLIVAERDKGDVLTLLKGIPYEIVQSTYTLIEEQLPQVRVKLGFLGFALAAPDQEPAFFVRTLPVLVAHYRANVAGDTSITVERIAEQLGVPVAAVRKLEPLFECEGHTGLHLEHDGRSWAIHVGEQILEWQDVDGLDEYLKRRERAHELTANALAEMVGRGGAYRGASTKVKSAGGGSFAERGFHPDVVRVASKLYADGHRPQAVEESFKLLLARVKQQSGRYDLDGAKLIGAVLGGQTPPLRVNTLANSFERSEQEGWTQLFLGAWQAIRNRLLAHESEAALSEQDTLDQLTLVSMLLTKLEEMTVASA